MSDFLTNLAVRSAGSAEVIQPRLPSLFEPPVFGSHSAPVFVPHKPREEKLEEETLGEVTRKSEAAPGAVANNHISGMPARGASTVQAPAPQAESEAGVKPHPRLQAEDRQRAIRPPLPLPGEIALDPTARHTLPKFPAAQFDSKSVVPSQPLVREPVVGAVPTQSGKEERERMHSSSNSTRSYKAAGDPPAPFADVEKSLSNEKLRSRRPVSPRIEHPNSPSNLSPQVAKSVVEPRARPRSAPARRGAASSQVSPSEPTIHVMIGRIEVRATPQQPQAHRERSASSVMSLNEYLRSRENRHRE